MDRAAPLLKLEGITKRFKDRTVLNNISLDIEKGQIKILIGPSGTGKSTLLHCINYLTRPDSGRIFFDGHLIDASSSKGLLQYRQKVGMIFQDFNLFDHLTAKHNVAIGLMRVKKLSRNASYARALKELEKVGLKDHAEKYPAELSGGQKQRVSIARALAMDPEVMLLDEPTSALDPELMGEVLSAIRKLAEGGMTMIMATHEIKFAASVANEIIFLENGGIVEQGPPDQILYNGRHQRTKQFCCKLTDI
jgi:polar amino acid transport system ATP-binding protein